ncbi:M20 metallopeptidase family protein [Staphylococcus massiliensis]|uniref:N-acetyl-L,L-diaminopimelate deacetylase n=1 Tax=Staphylococcus massiliensis S46 TaxID=1229783 RepID=K9AIF5_9STAP|nr:amidohydrolase [Staphylococcus massiliensis]EKU47113.1 N-acetyl-L,L-diaminopimelate deacetylase [Staphylococcus massiliensis S46]MCG3398594.1 amidohydrolase [Staphylococcus massiliensis]MCG3401159.1 amidohydrolase [Staphylococcus massiliensis]MCG3412296.1 amidohydrolase [Staphylococcus massiliensis]POA01872.1 amidohydrolase [Staphylococcus massiliensis CCUG 55927]
MTDLEFVTHHRRHLHQYPEVSLQEFDTTAYIVNFLEELEIPYERPLQTGVIGRLEGNSDKTIAFRADIDALPITEENDVSYKSQHEGRMHACGHDGHTTALMLFVTRCKALYDKGALPHNVIFIFQPAEESGGGANLLIQEGAFSKDDINAIFGVHVMPFEEEGKVVVKDHELTASATEYRFFLKGLSSHVANKEQGRATSEALAHVITQLTQIQHFHLNGLKRNIVHIGRFSAGEAINTVPSNGYLEGTIRTYDMDDLSIIQEQMKKISESVKALYGVSCELKFEVGYPPTMNAPVLKDHVLRSLELNQLEPVFNEEPYLFGEDFSFYNQIAPSYFVFFGTRNVDKDFVTGLHTSTLNFDEKILVDVANFYEQLLMHFNEE